MPRFDFTDLPAPTRQSNGQFAAGNSGRPRGSRNRLTRRVTEIILNDFATNYHSLMPYLHTLFLPHYVKLLCTVLPKSADANEPDYHELTGEEFDERVAALRAMLDRVQFGEATLLDLEGVLVGTSEPVGG